MDTTFALITFLLGIFVTLEVQRLTLKGKFQEIVYREKVIMFKEIFDAYNAILCEIRTQRQKENGCIACVHDKAFDLMCICFRYSGVIPINIMKECVDYGFNIGKINEIPEFYNSDYKVILSRKLIPLMREELKTEKLSEETNDLINNMFMFP
jgi:hypothetical protein